MRVKTVIILMVTLIFVSSAFSFDGLRKGFVLGGGLGFSPAFKWETDDPFFDFLDVNIDESNTGVGLNFIIGYGWDEKNMIVYDGNVAGGNSDFLNQTITQGFNGASWYHYFGPTTGKQFFTTVGIGFYVFDGEDFNANDPGGGVLLGGGYEFAPHWQVGAYLSAGKTSDMGVDFSHSHINILISGVAF